MANSTLTLPNITLPNNDLPAGYGTPESLQGAFSGIPQTVTPNNSLSFLNIPQQTNTVNSGLNQNGQSIYASVPVAQTLPVQQPTAPVVTQPQANVPSGNSPVNNGGSSPTPQSATPPTYYNGQLTDYGRSLGLSDNTQPNASPAGSVNSVLNGLNTTPEQAQIDAYTESLKQSANSNFDQNAVANQTLQIYQSQIDAINNAYNDQLNRSRIENAPGFKANLDQNRLEQLQGGFGTSSMGAAQTSQVNKQNQDTQAAQDAVFAAQRQDAINNVYGKVSDAVVAAKAAFDLAKSKDTASYIEQLNNKSTQKASQVSTTAKALIATLTAQGIDPNSLTADELQPFADKIGVPVTDIISAVSSAAADQQATQQKSDKAAADLANTQANTAKTTAETGQVGKMTPYQSQQLALDWYKAKNPTIGASDKKLSAVAGIATLFSPSEIVDGKKTNVVPGSDGIPYVDNNGYITPEGWKTVSREAIGDGLSIADLLEHWGDMLSPTQLSSYGLDPREIKYVQTELPATNG